MSLTMITVGMAFAGLYRTAFSENFFNCEDEITISSGFWLSNGPSASVSGSGDCFNSTALVILQIGIWGGNALPSNWVDVFQLSANVQVLDVTQFWILSQPNGDHFYPSLFRVINGMFQYNNTEPLGTSRNFNFHGLVFPKSGFDEAMKGNKGDQGDTGTQGIQGIQGDTGETGIQGEKGNSGAASSVDDDALERYDATYDTVGQLMVTDAILWIVASIIFTTFLILLVLFLVFLVSWIVELKKALLRKVEDLKEANSKLPSSKEIIQSENDSKRTQEKDKQENSEVKDKVEVMDKVEVKIKRALEYGRVKFDFEAQEEGELSLSKGTIVVIESKDVEWFTGRLYESKDQQSGMFPSEYVKLLKDYDPKTKEEEKSDECDDEDDTDDVENDSDNEDMAEFDFQEKNKDKTEMEGCLRRSASQFANTVCVVLYVLTIVIVWSVIFVFWMIETVQLTQGIKRFDKSNPSLPKLNFCVANATITQFSAVMEDFEINDHTNFYDYYLDSQIEETEFDADLFDLRNLSCAQVTIDTYNGYPVQVHDATVITILIETDNTDEPIQVNFNYDTTTSKDILYYDYDSGSFQVEDRGNDWYYYDCSIVGKGTTIGRLEKEEYVSYWNSWVLMDFPIDQHFYSEYHTFSNRDPVDGYSFKIVIDIAKYSKRMKEISKLDLAFQIGLFLTITLLFVAGKNMIVFFVYKICCISTKYYKEKRMFIKYRDWERFITVKNRKKRRDKSGKDFDFNYLTINEQGDAFSDAVGVFSDRIKASAFADVVKKVEKMVAKKRKKQLREKKERSRIIHVESVKSKNELRKNSKKKSSKDQTTKVELGRKEETNKNQPTRVELSEAEVNGELDDIELEENK